MRGKTRHIHLIKYKHVARKKYFCQGNRSKDFSTFINIFGRQVFYYGVVFNMSFKLSVERGFLIWGRVSSKFKPCIIVPQFKTTKKCRFSLKRIGFLLNMYPGEEPLRFRTNIPNRKCIQWTPFETFLGLARLYETLKVPPGIQV